MLLSVNGYLCQFYSVVLALVRPIINCFSMLLILRCICCHIHPDLRGHYSSVFVRTVSVIIHVIGCNLKSIHLSRSDQYNWCIRSTSIWFILQNSANIFVRIVFYVILAFVEPIVIFRFFKLSNLRVGCYSCIIYFLQTGIRKKIETNLSVHSHVLVAFIRSGYWYNLRELYQCSCCPHLANSRWSFLASLKNWVSF